ncbi:MAG: heme-binding domain-containing protein [Actinomycetota bacterium]|nr:heme-binding domain-containing protein [Actinomycetota bacterium]MDH5223790.1 heme-binding domain-containing protein [Actinomycetota bacterium]MDH5312837.1 heme-binding domain-containing protein [Actinomycetota bacterium]
MPPTSYRLIHPAARLSEEERATLIAAMRQMLRDSPPIDGDGDGEGSD